MELIFEITDELESFIISLPRRWPAVITEVEESEAFYYVSEGRDKPAEVITREEFVKRGYDKFNINRSKVTLVTP